MEIFMYPFIRKESPKHHISLLTCPCPACQKRDRIWSLFFLAQKSMAEFVPGPLHVIYTAAAQSVKTLVDAPVPPNLWAPNTWNRGWNIRIRQYNKYIHVAYIYICTYTWNLFVLYFGASTQTRSFPSKTGVIWVPGIHKYIDIYITVTIFVCIQFLEPRCHYIEPGPSDLCIWIFGSNCTNSTQLDDQDSAFQETETILVWNGRKWMEMVGKW